MINIARRIRRAIWDFDMIRNGDKIAVAVSGGWDSLTLLSLLWQERFALKLDYSLLAIHILGDGTGHWETAHQPLVDWLDAFRAETGIDYRLARFMIPEKEKLPMDCFRCSWNRRKSIFITAHENGCNKVAFGHHFDDNVETALLNLFCKGRLEMMNISQPLFGGVIHVIRPLVYVPKAAITEYAVQNDFPEPPSPCPVADVSRRALMGKILEEVESSGFRNARKNIFRTAIEFMKQKGVDDGGNDTQR